MALLIPEQPKECPYGERITYEKFGRELDSDWVVLHSLGLHAHEKKIWGEADIVVLGTKGFFAIEVKGGKVSCKNGIWYFGEPNGTGYTKKEDPWTQAKGTMFAIQNCLTTSDTSFREVLFGFGVVMPMETFTATGAEIEPEILLDRREFSHNLGLYIGRLQRHWLAAYRAKHGRDPRMPTKAEVKQAQRILRPDVDSAYNLGSYLTGVESELVQLTHEQIRASRRMAANPRTVVRGKAGTGKTVIAIERARQLAAGGAHVLFLCFNQLLATHLRTNNSLGERAQLVEIRHAHSLYHEVIAKAGLLKQLEAAVDERELFAEIYPRVFVDAAFEVGHPSWDALVIDEAQDLLTPANIDAFDLMLGVPGINRGRWHIFLDRQQNIYGSHLQEQVEERLAEAQPAFDDLFENCRNTRQVAVQASILSGIDLALEGAPDGPECDNVYYRDHKGGVAALDRTIRKLISQGILPREIAVLSSRKRAHSIVANRMELGGVALVDAHEAKENDMIFSTMHAFKGLERLVVLAIDMEGLGEENWSMLHYAGLSRARGLLHTFLQESKRPIYAAQATGFGERISDAG